MRRVVILAVTLIILGLFNFNIYKKEKIMGEGHTVLLKLAPVDPRSLMQGDYMQLRYAIIREAERKLFKKEIPRKGSLVITLDENEVASFVRIYGDEPLAPGEYLLNYRRRGDLHLGAESFLFQEGHAEIYEKAQYGELKVTESGESVLVGLRDEHFNKLGPEPADQSSAPYTD